MIADSAEIKMVEEKITDNIRKYKSICDQMDGALKNLSAKFQGEAADALLSKWSEKEPDLKAVRAKLEEFEGRMNSKNIELGRTNDKLIASYK